MRVLIVDDSSNNADFLAKLIQSYKHELVVASSGQEAVEIAPRFHPRLILMDISMPTMDGYETSRRLRDFGIGAPIVALTALEIDRSRLADAGIDMYRRKPLHLRDLRALMGC